jgi:hypothetical protein
MGPGRDLGCNASRWPRTGSEKGDERVLADGRPAVELGEAELAGLTDLDRPVRFRPGRAGTEREVTQSRVVQVP